MISCVIVWRTFVHVSCGSFSQDLFRVDVVTINFISVARLHLHNFLYNLIKNIHRASFFRNQPLLSCFPSLPFFPSISFSTFTFFILLFFVILNSIYFTILQNGKLLQETIRFETQQKIVQSPYARIGWSWQNYHPLLPKIGINHPFLPYRWI